MEATHTKRDIIIRHSRELLLTVVVVFAFTTVVLLLAGAPPLDAYYHIFKGSLGS